VNSEDLVTIHAKPHPDPKVQRVGFGLDHPYLELVWGSAVGPSVVHLLRRLPDLWGQAMPVRMTAGELASGLGFPGKGGLDRTTKRVVAFGLGEWESPQDLAVYTQVRALPSRLMRLAPDWVVTAHERLLTDHLHQLQGGTAPQPDSVARVRTQLDRHQPPVARPLSPGPNPLAR